MTHGEREIETIRRLREALRERNVPAPTGPFDRPNQADDIHLDELAEVIYEIQS